jgi:asparagine synthase (glutamine-hydrolysing)
MCGIAGFVDSSGKTQGNVLHPMIDSIAYRGPDSWGEFHSKENIAHLGVRRLRIIDLKKGDQPINNEDGEIVIVFNGEIYNYKEIRKFLLKKGHKFKTESDTEVIVHGYEEFGESFIEKLNGMFAFAIWDNRNRKLILARDRVGIKPLYYYHNGDSLVFGSEPKTILRFPNYRKQLNPESLELYFYFGFIPGYTSIYKSINKVPPGYYLIFKDKKIIKKRYFELETNKTDNNRSLDDILEDSVKRQLVSDVPVGVFLSGGLDSSLVAYYISKYEKLKSFSIGFSESGFDESEYAHYVAKMIGTKH